MAKPDQNLFQKLTRLFRSGPVVRRKLRNLDTTVAVADKTKSSGTLLFQKSMSPTYASITANAYNLTERLMRYQDFGEMEYTAEIASALDIYCLAPDTIIPLLNGTKLTVKELFDSKRENFEVYSFDNDNCNYVPGLCSRVVKTGTNQQLFKITFDDSTSVRLTENHLVLLTDGSYKRTKDLMPSDSIRSMYTKISSFSTEDRIDCYEHINHKVTSVTPDGFDDVFDLQVDRWHNFAIASEPTATSCIIVHNSDETCAVDDKGRSLHIYSDNEKIREILEDLFYNTINVEFNLRSWTRNLVKYGDCFLYNDVSPEHGVINAIPIPVNEIEREENFDPNDPMAVRYRWVTLGNRTLENWEVTHFRLLGNDMFLPYGSSVIEPARRIWRQLILIEDAMLVYRVVRAPERRVFYIDVANIPPENVEMYVEQQKKALRSTQVVDNATSRVDLRYNPLPVHKDTPIPLLDGTTLTIENLSKKMKDNTGWIPWVYSVQDGTKNIVPGKVAWCDKNYTASTLTKVWLDDGSYVLTAPEHPYVMRDGSSKRADQISPGDSLMSAYRDLNNRGYERIVEPNGELNSTHVIVARDAHQSKWNSTEGRVVHHKHPENGASNKRDNRPENLEVMNFWEHRKMHAEHCELTLNRPEQLEERRIKRIAFNKSPEKRKRTSALNKVLGKAKKMGDAYNGSVLHASHNDIRREAQKKSWSLDKDSRSEKMQWIIPNSVVTFVFNEIKSNRSIGREELTSAIRNNSSIIESLRNVNDSNERNVDKFHVSAVVSKIHRMGCIDKTSFREFRKFALTHEVPVNHQVVKVESISANDDVYCMTVMGIRGEDDRHNFAVNGLGQTTDVNLLKSLLFVLNSVDEDYFIPVRGADSGTKIDTLAGGQNTAAVEDVAYIQKKLFAALKIPRAYLGYDESLCLAGNSLVPLLDGRTVQIDQLVEEFESKSGQDKSVYVYSCDTETGKIVPGKVIKAWKTKDVTEFYRVMLDTGGHIDCTGNHPFLCRDGLYRRADELASGQSLMPLYRKLSHGKKFDGKDLIDGYEMILDNVSGEWKYTHKAVNDAISGGNHKVEKQRVIHHVDCDKRNNDPSNLQEMSWYEHRKWHSEHLESTLLRPDVIARARIGWLKWIKSARHSEFKSVMMKAATTTPGNQHYERIHSAQHAVKMSEVMQNNWANPEYRKLKSLQSKQNWEKETYRSRYVGDNHWSRRQNSDFTIDHLKNFCIENGVRSINQWRKEHPASVRDISPVGSRFVKGLIKRSGFSSWRDFASQVLFIDVPKRCSTPRNHKVVSVEIIKLDSPMSVYDIEVEQWHNFAVGSNRIVELQKGVSCGDDYVFVHNSSKATLAQEDIRFSRTISVVQKTIISELNKLAIIHLYAHGFDSEDLQNFTLRLSNPSTIAQQQKLELWRAKFEIAGTAPEGHMSKDFVRREIWGLNDEQCKAIDDHRLKEKLVDSMIESATNDSGEDGDGGDEEADIFGGDEDGESATEPAGDAGEGGEEPEAGGGEDLFAGHDIMQNNAHVGLMTAGDDPEDDEDFPAKLSVSNVKTPVNVQRQLDKVLYNRGRIRHHGASKTHMPDFAKMTNSKHDDDPFDNSWMKSLVKNPFGESTAPLHKTVITGDVMRSLSNMQRRFTREMPSVQSKSVLTEVAGYLEGADSIENEEVLIIDEDNE